MKKIIKKYLVHCDCCGKIIERKRRGRHPLCDGCYKYEVLHRYHTNPKYRQSLIESAKQSMKKKRKYGTRKDRWAHPDSIELKKKLGENIIKAWVNNHYRSKVPDSPPQRDLFKFLKEKYPNKHFEYNYFFPNDVTWYWLDIAELDSKICIEVDGWLHKLKWQKESDERRDNYLLSKGWKVIRIKTSDVYPLIKQGTDIFKILEKVI